MVKCATGCKFLKFYIKIMFVYIRLYSFVHFLAFIWFYYPSFEISASAICFYFIACLSQAIVCHQNKRFHCTLPVKDICANLGAGLGCDHLFLNCFFTAHQIDRRTSTLLLDFQILLDNMF